MVNTHRYISQHIHYYLPQEVFTLKKLKKNFFSKNNHSLPSSAMISKLVKVFDPKKCEKGYFDRPKCQSKYKTINFNHMTSHIFSGQEINF